MPKPRSRRPATLCLFALLAACTQLSGWQRLDPDRLTAEQGARVQRARQACEGLGGALKTRLMEAMGQGGPLAAIEVCRTAAREITGEVAAQQGVRIGRTSHRLRNPDNAPPAWAAAHVARAKNEPGVWAKADGTLGVLVPIPTAGLCIQCHGPADAIAQPIRERLAQHYPADRATGFAPDQLRGWFWVEVR